MLLRDSKGLLLRVRPQEISSLTKKSNPLQDSSLLDLVLSRVRAEPATR